MAHDETYSDSRSASAIGLIASTPTCLRSAGSLLRRLKEDTSWTYWHERSRIQSASGGQGYITEPANTCPSRAKYTVTAPWTLHMRGRKGLRPKDIFQSRTT
jgi:hypothetical protein